MNTETTKEILAFCLIYTPLFAIFLWLVLYAYKKRPRKLMEKFGALPPWIEIEGAEFTLQLIVNGRPDDIRLVYSLERTNNNSRHFENWRLHGCWENPFDNDRAQGFLFLYENIKNDDDLELALSTCYAFLITHNLNK